MINEERPSPRRPADLAGGIFLPVGILLGGLAGGQFGNVTIGILAGLAGGLISAGIFSWYRSRP